MGGHVERGTGHRLLNPPALSPTLWSGGHVHGGKQSRGQSSAPPDPRFSQPPHLSLAQAFPGCLLLPHPSKGTALAARGCEWRGSEDTPLVPPPPLTASLLLCPLQTVEPVDQLLRKVDPAKDRELWVREHKTGNIRPVDMEI